MKGEILYDLLELEEGQSIKIISSREDLFLNSKIEEYNIYKKDGCLYIKKIKNIGLNKSITFNEKIKDLKVSKYFIDKVNKTSLSSKEIELMCKNSREKYFIRKNYSVKGTFENNTSFDYRNIIAVN
jgi:hypothetical protein